MKIFIGLANITSLFHEYAKGFRELGHEVFTVETVTTPPYVDGVQDVDLNVHTLASQRAEREKGGLEAYNKWYAHYMELAWQKALDSDFCLFIWKTFRPDCHDLVELKRRGIKLAVRFCGAEVRVNHAADQFTDYLQRPPMNRPTGKSPEKALHYVRMAEKFADVILGASEIGLRPMHSASAMMVDMEQIPVLPAQRECPVILHAPSGRSRKGTTEWLQIFEALRNERHKFGLKFCERIPHQDFLKEYATADIYCGSLNIRHGGGTWGIGL